MILIGCALMALIDAMSWPYPLKAIFKMTLFIGIPWGWSRQHPDWPKTPLSGLNRSVIWRLVGLAVIEVTVLTVVMGWVMPYLDTSLLEGILRQNFEGRPVVFFGVTLYIVLINAFLEEWYFRGFAFLRIQNAFPKPWALVFSALLFSAYHLALMAGLFPLPLYLVFVIGLAGVGALFNVIDHRFQSLWPSFVIHASANLAMNLMAMRLLGFL